MANLKYQPVTHDHTAFLEKAIKREEKYAHAVGCHLEIKFVPEQAQ